jgi:hypothetical protein
VQLDESENGGGGGGGSVFGGGEGFRQPCRYGNRCYNRSKEHWKKFSHSGRRHQYQGFEEASTLCAYVPCLLA